jgi:hypothetical protein
MSDAWERSTFNVQRSTFNKEKEEKRVRGIEPPCAAWEAAVLPLNYTRGAISDFRFAVANCNRTKSGTSGLLKLADRIAYSA